MLGGRPPERTVSEAPRLLAESASAASPAGGGASVHASAVVCSIEPAHVCVTCSVSGTS